MFILVTQTVSVTISNLPFSGSPAVKAAVVVVFNAAMTQFTACSQLVGYTHLGILQYNQKYSDAQ